MIRVFVGRDEAEATDWFARTRDSFSRLIPDYDLADQGAGDGVDVVMFRDGNVAVMVRTEDGSAAALAVSLRARIVDGVPGLAYPTMQRVADGWTITAPGAEFVQPHGLAPIRLLGGLTFTSRPVDITVWDAYGRAIVVK